MKKKVLIVDDDSSFVSRLMNTIIFKEMTISIADSINRAKFLINNEAYDLILANVRVPGGCSLELKNEYTGSGSTSFLFMSDLESDYNFINGKGEKCFYKYNLNWSLGDFLKK